MFSLISTWTNSWASNGDARNLRRHRSHYDVIIMHLIIGYQYSRSSIIGSWYYVTGAWIGYIELTIYICCAACNVVLCLVASQRDSTTSWWRHQMETFSALLAICAGNSPVIGEFPAQRPVTRNFDVFFDLRLNKRLSKQSWGWWFKTPSRPLWRQCNDIHTV